MIAVEWKKTWLCAQRLNTKPAALLDAWYKRFRASLHQHRPHSRQVRVPLPVLSNTVRRRPREREKGARHAVPKRAKTTLLQKARTREIFWPFFAQQRQNQENHAPPALASFTAESGPKEKGREEALFGPVYVVKTPINSVNTVNECQGV